MSSYTQCYGLNCVPQNLYIDALTRNVFGDRTFTVVIMVKWGYKGGRDPNSIKLMSLEEEKTPNTDLCVWEKRSFEDAGRR